MNTETVAVIMTAYNENESWFKAAIDSILSQTYTDIHLYLLLDNPDNKRLWEIMENYSDLDNRVSIFRNEKNLGLVGSLNKLLTMVEEPYIARMDADDISCETRIEKEMIFLKENHLDFVMSGIDFIRDENREAGPDIPTLLKEDFSESEKYGNLATHPTWLLKHDVYTNLCGYRDLQYCEDLDFVLRAIQKGYQLGRMKDILLHYRVRENGISVSYAYEQYEKAHYLHSMYASGKKISDINPKELNERRDFKNEKIKDSFQKQKSKIDVFASNLYQKKYCLCLLGALKGIISSRQYRRIFFDTVKSNRRMAKIYEKARKL